MESKDDDDHFHHGEGYSTQSNFRMKVVSLVEAFEDMGNPFLDQSGEHPNVFVANVIDGTASVHLLPTTALARFDEYADLVFILHLVRQLEKCSRLDLVWDTYIQDSIKASTRIR